MRQSFRSNAAHIVGGGPSAAGLDFTQIPDPDLIIGVNDSAFNLPRCDWVVSIDGRWMKHRWKQLTNRLCWLRRTSFEKHVGNIRWPGLNLGECNVEGDGPGEDFYSLYGNNSGLVALNLAYFMGYETIFLYGFDMGFEAKKHWYPEYEWAAKGNHMYPAFSRQFDAMAKYYKDNKVEVINVSPTSRLECFKKVDYDTAKNLFHGIRKA